MIGNNEWMFANGQGTSRKERSTVGGVSEAEAAPSCITHYDLHRHGMWILDYWGFEIGKCCSWSI